jgi:spermidine synthase
MAWARLGVYACFFFSGATSLVFEVLWSCQFVTVFGNSSYAVSVVLCAYMTGLGLGGLIGGKIADRITRRMTAFGAVQVAVAGWALAMPLLLAWFRVLTPTLAALSPESLLVSTLTRFGLSFAVLAVPCFLMGTTLPLLVRAVTNSDRFISRRIGALYCWNTLGAAFGCLAAGFWMLDTLGLRLTNLLAVSVNILVGLAAFALSKPLSSATGPMPAAAPQSKPTSQPAELEPGEQVHAPSLLLLGIAFVNGLAGLTCEVLWFRYLAFLIFNRAAYMSSMILCIYLLGLGLGGLVYSLLARRIQFSIKALWVIQVLLAISVLVMFVVGAMIFAAGPPSSLGVEGMALVTVLLPTVLMGMAFPLLCNLYGRRVQKLGQRVGLLFAVNTAGTVLGSLLPIFVLVPLLGIQRSVLLASLLFGGMGLGLLAWGVGSNRRYSAWVAGVYAGTVLLFLTVVPSNLCQRVFLATGFNLAKHTDILFYREGRTGTAIVTRDRVNHCKEVYINGTAEVPALYADQLCFKMLGDLGPMLHPNPDNVLMICFGGGIAAGATTCLPEVKSLTIVDLESSVVEATSLLAEENNEVLQNPKIHVVIDDGRNYIMTARRKWPVIITDSTHPKAPDSWVLYSQEFYRQVRDHLTDDGVFVQWVPRHSLSTAEYKIILRTFQSVFPHASLWVTGGMDEQGQFVLYTLLVATPKPLSINVSQLRDRLNAGPVRLDLEPYGLHTTAGFLDTFLCAEDTLRHWVGEGPINTDDLPYTYYNTRYSKSGEMGYGVFVGLMEDVWPWLTGTGSKESAERLHHELALRAKVNRLAFSGRLGEAYTVLPEDIRYRQMRRLYEEGPYYIDALLSTYWDNPQGLIYLVGLRVSGPGAFQAIRPILERALDLDRNNVNALSMLGGMYSAAGDLMVGENYLRRAVHLETKFGEAHYNLGNALLQKGSVDEAITHFQKALQINPDYEDAHINLGNALLQKGSVDEAITHYQKALEIEPDHADTHNNLALALLQKGSVDEAITHFQKALQIKPDYVEAQNDLAWVLATASQASLRNGKKAVELSEQANQLAAGKDPNILHTLAAAYAEAGRFGDARRSAQKAIELARAAGRQDMVEEFNGELKLYEGGLPLHQESK